MTPVDTTALLNRLTGLSTDGHQGFMAAARLAYGPHLRSLFSEYATECARAVRELQDCVHLLGGVPETRGTAAGALHRGWMQLRTSMTRHDDVMLLETCEAGERIAIGEYRAALDASPPVAVHAVIQRQYQGALRHHERIRDLRHNARLPA